MLAVSHYSRLIASIFLSRVSRKKQYVNRKSKQGRTQTEEEISALSEMSRAASLFPSSLPETDRRACTQLKCQLVLKGDTLLLRVWLKCQRTKLSPPPHLTMTWAVAAYGPLNRSQSHTKNRI